MKKINPFAKYKYNWSAIIIMAILVIVLGCGYAYTVVNASRLNDLLQSAEVYKYDKEKLTEEYNTTQMVSEVILVGFSVAGSALFSSLLIEKKNANNIVEDVFNSEFFVSKRFLQSFSDEDKKKLLVALEQQLNFSGCKEKADMYVTVKEKINTPVSQELYYENYYLNIVCDVKQNYIEKTVVRSIEIKSLNSGYNTNVFPILSIATPPSSAAEYKSVEIKKVKVDNKEIDLNLISEKSGDEGDDPINIKRGYSKSIQFMLNKTLRFNRKKSTKIEIEYITRCPLYDKAYTCRMQYPCRKFDFNFVVRSGDYVINPSAFGFIDDGKNSPNMSDRRRVSIKFNDWIFPLDGVCVFLEKTIA